MTELDFSEYGQDLFLSTSEQVTEDDPANQSQNNCASCNNSLQCGMTR
ncbi:MAG: hypothetical protein K2P90_02790 [Holosporales bacterium]|jgi:hypothetical protein|nr:hypothetical protein [Holosporales bacterium]